MIGLDNMFIIWVYILKLLQLYENVYNYAGITEREREAIYDCKLVISLATQIEMPRRFHILWILTTIVDRWINGFSVSRITR